MSSQFHFTVDHGGDRQRERQRETERDREGQRGTGYKKVWLVPSETTSRHTEG